MFTVPDRLWLRMLANFSVVVSLSFVIPNKIVDPGVWIPGAIGLGVFTAIMAEFTLYGWKDS